MILKMVIVYVCENCGSYLNYEGNPMTVKETEIINESNNIKKIHHPTPCCTLYEYHKKWLETYDYYSSRIEEWALGEKK